MGCAQAKHIDSLNFQSRKRALQRITRENLHIVSRIQGQAATYSIESHRRHAEAHARYRSQADAPCTAPPAICTPRITRCEKQPVASSVCVADL